MRLTRAARAPQEAYEAYRAHFDASPAHVLRDCLELTPAGPPVPLEEVQPAGDILTRFCTGGMSLGAISRETHETIAIAMNRIGGAPTLPWPPFSCTCSGLRFVIRCDTHGVTPTPSWWSPSWHAVQQHAHANAPHSGQMFAQMRWAAVGASAPRTRSPRAVVSAGKSNSGEGGEDPARWDVVGNVDDKGVSAAFP